MNQNNKIFTIASIVNGACFAMILPLLAPLIRELNLSELQGGALVSIGAFSMVIMAIYIAKQQKKMSLYRLMYIGFLGMCVTWGSFAAILNYGLNTHLSVMTLFILLMLIRAASGIFMAMPQIALQSYVMMTFQGEKPRSQAMSRFGALNSLGVIFGPTLTTLLLGWGILTPLWVATLILAVMTVIIMIYFHQDVQTYQHDDSTMIGRIHEKAHSLTIWSCRFWLLLGFSLYVAIVTVNLTAGFYLQDQFQLKASQSAIYFAQCSLIVGISLVIMQTAIARFLQLSLQKLLLIGLSCMLIGLFISLSSQRIWVFQFGYIFYGIAVACLTPAFTTGASQMAPAHLQTKVAGWCTATQALSFVVGPLLSTGLYFFDKTLPYISLLVLIFLLFILQFFVKFHSQLLSTEQ